MKRVLVVLLFFFGGSASFSASASRAPDPVHGSDQITPILSLNSSLAYNSLKLKQAKLKAALNKALKSNIQSKSDIEKAINLAKKLGEDLEHCKVNASGGSSGNSARSSGRSGNSARSSGRSGNSARGSGNSGNSARSSDQGSSGSPGCSARSSGSSGCSPRSSGNR